MNGRLQAVQDLNPEFAEALERGDRWAIEHAEMVRGIDGESSRRHPERVLREDGTRRNWCGSCGHKDGCVMCDLDGDPEGMKGYIGTQTD